MAIAETGQTDSFSGVLARHVASTAYSDLPETVIHAFRRTLCDYLACVFAAADLPVTRGVREWVASQGTAPRATVIGTGMRASATEAALINGAAAHGLDFDDGFTRSSSHPGGVVFSAALAAAEENGSSMSELILAVVLGYDVMLRIASTMHPASASQGWHNTPVAGVFGATAVAARLRGLDAITTRNALGLAASFSGGIRQYLRDGAEVKRIHPGKAARDGIVCAGLAEHGITGAIACLEGADGLFRAMVNNAVDETELLRELGETFHIASAYFKPYPCCRHFHAAIDAALDLRAEENLTSTDVSSIEIGLYEVGAHGHDHITARNLLECQMSAPCAVTAALRHGRLSAALFYPDAFSDPESQRLLAATRTYVDEECERLYPQVRTGFVALQLADGRRLERRVVEPRGENANPLTDDDLSRKFLDNATEVLGEAEASALLETIWRLGGGSDLAGLFKRLAASRG